MMEMPKVNQCDVTECSYNQGKACHALAITVGDGMIPHCDTFCSQSMRGGDQQAVAGVGACKVSGCKFNSNLECSAPGIMVGHHGNEVECLTYTPA